MHRRPTSKRLFGGEAFVGVSLLARREGSGRKTPPEGRAGGRRAVLVIASVWLVALGVAFFLNRGDDAGQLVPLSMQALSTMRTGPVWGASGLIASVEGLIIASLIVLSWLGLGDLASRLSRRDVGRDDSPRALELAARCLFGAVLWSTVWMGLGVLHLYRDWAAVTAVVVGLGSFALALPSLLTIRSSAPPFTASGSVAVTIVVAVMVLALMAALAPPTGRDALFYHFALPKAYIEAGGSVVVTYNMATYYPQGIEMHVVWAMLLGRLLGRQAAEAAAGATVFAFAPLLALVTYGWARERRVEPAWATIAALMIVSVPTVYDIAGSGYVDLAVASYTALAVHAVARWWSTLDQRWIWPIALAVAGALSIKLPACFLVLLLAAVVLVRAVWGPASTLMPRPRVVAAGMMALALSVLIVAPWYIRTWIRTGSPVFPFYLNIWPGAAPGWDVDRSRLYQSLLSAYGAAHGPLDYVLAPVRLAVSAQPDVVARYDGVLGIAFLFGLPVLLWALVRRRLDVDLKIAAALAAALFVFWLLSTQQIRFLLPTLPALAVTMVASGTAAERIVKGGLLRWLFIGAAAAGVPVIVAWFAMVDPVRVVLGGESRSAYLARRLDYYPYYEVINERLSATDRVWLIDMRRDSYHIDRPYFSDFVFEDYTLARYVRDARQPADVLARARAAGITHLLVRHDVLLDYARSPIVDDRRPRDENLARLNLLARFFVEGTRLLKGDQKFWLIELPREGPRSSVAAFFGMPIAWRLCGATVPVGISVVGVTFMTSVDSHRGTACELDGSGNTSEANGQECLTSGTLRRLVPPGRQVSQRGAVRGSVQARQSGASPGSGQQVRASSIGLSPRSES